MRIVCLLLLLLSLPLHAEIYRHVDERGVVHYSDKPTHKDARPAQLPPLQTVPALPPSESGEGGTQGSGSQEAAPPPSLQVEITAPQHDEVLRDPRRTLAIQAAVTPALPPGYALRFFLDGRSVTEPPVTSMSYRLEDLARGSHQVAVAVVDASGREVARSRTVSVHLLPPTAGPNTAPPRR